MTRRKGPNMFALAALICFVLVVFKAPVGINLTALGLAFVAAHLLIAIAIPTPWSKTK